MKKIKKGDKIYVETHLYISHGSDDVIGGLATVSDVRDGISGGKKHVFIEVEEHPGNSYNWSEFLCKKQEQLKKEFGKKKAHASPDIDTPWIEEGDIVGTARSGNPFSWH